MSIISNENKSLFFSPSEFGESFVFMDGEIIDGIFDNGFNDGDGVSSASPSLLTVESAEYQRGMIITRETDDVDYRIRDIQPDGTGLVTLKLEKQ